MQDIRLTMKMEHDPASPPTEEELEEIDLGLASTQDNETETMEQSEDIVFEAVRKFRSEIESRFPIRHLRDFYEEAKINQVAETHKRQTMKEFIDEGKDLTYLFELEAEFKKVIDLKLVKNKRHMEKCTPLLEALMDYLCEEYKYAVDEKLDHNSSMDKTSLEDMVAAEKTRILQSFLEDMKWIPGDFRLHILKLDSRITQLQNEYLGKSPPPCLILARRKDAPQEAMNPPNLGPSYSFKAGGITSTPSENDPVRLLDIQYRFHFQTLKYHPHYFVHFESGFDRVIESYGVKLFGSLKKSGETSGRFVVVSSTVLNTTGRLQVKRPHPGYTTEQQCYVDDIEKLLSVCKKRETNVYVKVEMRERKSPIAHVHADRDFPPKTFVSFIGGLLKDNIDIEEVKRKCQDPDQDLLFYMPPFQDIVHFYNINRNRQEFVFQGYVGNDPDNEGLPLKTMFPTCFTKIAKTLDQANVELRMVLRKPNNHARNRLHFFLSTLDKPVEKHEELLLVPFWLLPREGQVDPERVTYIASSKKDNKSKNRKRGRPRRTVENVHLLGNPDSSGYPQAQQPQPAKILREEPHQNTTVTGIEMEDNSARDDTIDHSNEEVENEDAVTYLDRKVFNTVGHQESSRTVEVVRTSFNEGHHHTISKVEADDGNLGEEAQF